VEGAEYSISSAAGRIQQIANSLQTSIPLPVGIRTLDTGVSPYNGLLSLPRSCRFNLPNNLHVGASALKWGDAASFGCICSPLCSPNFVPQSKYRTRNPLPRRGASQSHFPSPNVTSFGSFGTLLGTLSKIFEISQIRTVQCYWPPALKQGTTFVPLTTGGCE
jgi:hypothetical protein